MIDIQNTSHITTIKLLLKYIENNYITKSEISAQKIPS